MLLELSVSSIVPTIVEVGLAALLLVAGVSKLMDLQLWREALWGYRINWMRWRALVLLVPVAEVAIGLGVALQQPIAEVAAVAL